MANTTEKSAITIETTTTTSSDDEAAQDAPLYGSSGNDVHDMHRMGKTQELKRSFRYLSIISFVIILQSTWESILLAFQYGLTNGGTAGMASMAPTAGGQYHWVSEFAPKSWQKGMSYLVGWTAGLGWVTGVPSAAQLTSTLVQGLVLLRNPEAEVADLWQT
ncbi:MAG: hypothetical protein OHK93_003776 [Ramalina farinacea]|uniref:Uncharacterized protein n=1 Tax=Ramalina farinacea TaxID=258253 RepID=A0AA43QUM3_9LECA|nr:hypothetical protein [Ramalina farinacea]